MATTDPISKTLLDLFGAYSDRRQAQLDLERAQAKEATLGRTAIPGVMAELQARAEKEAAKKAKIAKAEEAGQPNPAAQVPQFTQITGQPDVRSTANALKSAVDIAATVSGGRGVKTGAVQPGVIQGQFGQMPPPGVGQGIVPPQQGAPGAGGGLPPPGAPGSMVQLPPQQLTGAQRAIGGATALLGVASRSPAAVAAGLSDLVTGERESGQFAQLPTVEQMAGEVSRNMWAAQQGFTGSAAAMNDQFTRIAAQYGPDVARQVANQALSMAAQDEAKAIEAANDPVMLSKRALAEAQLKAQYLGPESLTPGERFRLEGARRSTTVNVQNIMPATVTAQEAKISSNLGMMQMLDEIDAAFYPEYFTYGEDLKQQARTQAERAGLPISDEQKNQIAKNVRLRQALSQLSVDKFHEVFGANFSAKEMERADDYIQAAKQRGASASAAQASLSQLREMTALATLRAHTVITSGEGFKGNPADAFGLGDTRELAIEQTSTRINQLMDQGADLDAAKQQAFTEMRRAFGLKMHEWPEFQQPQPAGR